MFTTLLDATTDPASDLANLHASSWRAKLGPRAIKSRMIIDMLRCETPVVVAREVWSHLLAHDLVRGLKAADDDARKRPRQLSLNGAMQAIESSRASLRLARGRRRVDLLKAFLHSITAQELGGRLGRVEPRSIKRPRFEERKTLFRMNDPMKNKIKLTDLLILCM
jgi:hypothetical protein